MSVALEFDISADHAEALSDALLELGAASVTVEDADADTPKERPVFDEPGEPRGTWERARLSVLCDDEAAGRSLVEQACAELAIERPARIAPRPVDERDWVLAARSQFAPIRVSSRLWIVPSWHAAPDPAALNIVLDPGRAFGTGSHPTTLLCLQWLESTVRGGETVLDYGCGSGILAIAASRLGAGRVVGVDIDPQAIETARDNAAVNGAPCEFLDAGQDFSIQADIVVANILSNPLIVLAPVIASCARASGRIALAGILREQRDAVLEAYAPYIASDPVVELDGWLRVSGTRR